MSQTVTYTEQGSSTSKNFGKGVFGKKVKIMVAEDFSNPINQQPLRTIGSKGFTPDLCLKLTVESDGKTSDMYVMGQFTKDNISGRITGWNMQGNAVANLLSQFVGKDINVNDNFGIPESYVKALVGKEIYTISFCSGTYTKNDGTEGLSYSIYNKYRKADEESNLEDLYRMFLRSAPYLKKYDPELYETYKAQKEVSISTDMDSVSDEVPF